MEFNLVGFSYWKTVSCLLLIKLRFLNQLYYISLNCLKEKTELHKSRRLCKRDRWAKQLSKTLRNGKYSL